MKPRFDRLLRDEPFTLPRWVLYLVYLIIVGQGILLTLADSIAVPKLGLADYLIPYGLGVTILASVSLVAAYFRREWVECLSTFFLFAGLTSFVFFTFLDWAFDAADRGALSIVTILVLLLTLARSTVLFRGLVWRRAVRRMDK